MIENQSIVTESEATPHAQTATCRHCGCTSTLPQLFRKSWGRHYCPACASKIDTRNNILLFGWLGVLLVLDLVNGNLLHGWASWETWTVPLIILITILSLIFHELSHALVAKGLGGRVFGIQLGIGQQLLHHWFRDFYLGLSLLPVRGVCFAAFPPGKRLRLRYAFYIAGGLFFHIAVLCAALPLLIHSGDRFPFLAWVVLVNGLVFLFNALPRTVISAVGPTGTDGMLLWRLWRGQLNEQELRPQYYQMAATFAYQRNRLQEVRLHVREGLLLDPADEALENLRALLLLGEADKVGEAYTVWQEMVESETFASMPVLQQAIYYNNYAWATLMHRPAADSLQIARRYAEKAYQMAPWISAIKGTLAAVMVAQGEYQEGAAWALAVAREIEKEPSASRDEDVATNLATAALGYFYLGEQEKAKDLLQEATALAPNDLAVRKVVAEMQENMPAIAMEMASPLASS